MSVKTKLLGFSTIVATISMRSFGDNIVEWMDSIATAWWISAGIIVLMFIAWGVYELLIRLAADRFGLSAEAAARARLERDRATIGAEAEVARAELESRRGE